MHPPRALHVKYTGAWEIESPSLFSRYLICLEKREIFAPHENFPLYGIP